MNKSSNRDRLFAEVRSRFSKYETAPEKLLDRQLFIQPSSHRLTALGCVALGDIYQSYIFDHSTKITSKHILAIARNIEYPFYLTDTKLVLFSSEDAFLLKICGNHFETWINRIST